MNCDEPWFNEISQGLEQTARSRRALPRKIMTEEEERKADKAFVDNDMGEEWEKELAKPSPDASEAEEDDDEDDQ